MTMNYSTAPPLASAAQEPLTPDIFFAKHEINPRYRKFFDQIPRKTTVIIADDSGSMADFADKDNTASNTTRWDELRTALRIMIDAHAAYGTAVHVYTINQGYVLNVMAFEQVAHLFDHAPAGSTNMIRVLGAVAKNHMNEDMGRDLVIHILTDGHPTDDRGYENMSELYNWIISRQYKNKTFISVALCCDDRDVEALYRRLETGKNADLRVDVSMDYRGELVEIHRTHGFRYEFSYGSYIAKLLIGVFDPEIHRIDLPTGSCCVVS